MNLKKVYKKIKSQGSGNGLFNILAILYILIDLVDVITWKVMYYYMYYLFVLLHVMIYVLFPILVKEDGESSEGSANDPEFTGIYCTIDGKHMDDLPRRKYNI